MHMASKYVLLMRGINVNGVSMKMKDLKDALIGLGYPDVQTILATGNIILTQDASQAFGELETAEIARALGKEFQYDCHLFLRTGDEIGDVVAAASAVEVPDEFHHYCLFCDHKEVVSELSGLFASAPKAPGERFIPVGREAFWIVPKGSTLGTDFGSKVLGKKAYKSRLTSRNINTVNKIYAACSK